MEKSHSHEEALEDLGEGDKMDSRRAPLCPPWTRLTEGIFHRWVRRFVVAVSTSAAKYPRTWVAAVALFSVAVVVIGLFTNFYIEWDFQAFLLPTGSLPDVHSQWIQQEFENVRAFTFLVHSPGANVLTAQGMRRAMQVMDTVQTTEGYLDVCPDATACPTFAVTEFWDNQPTRLENALNQFPTVAEQDAYVQRTVSNTTFANGMPVLHEVILGFYQNVTTNSTEKAWILTSAQGLFFNIDLPDQGPSTDELETQLLDTFGGLQEQFTETTIQLEYFSLKTITSEFQRTLFIDMPLVPVMVLIMMAFTCFVFYRHKQKVHSHALLGILAFVTVGCSLMTGFGLMFIVGVPLTTVGVMVPFVVTGVALDDTFIITGTYFRHQKANKNRGICTISILQKTMEEVALSITMTTCTTVVCFLLGSFCSIAGARWMCFYALSTIAVDYFYQITFFVALLKLDDERIQDNRRDLLCCIKVTEGSENGEAGEENPLEQVEQKDNGDTNGSVAEEDRDKVDKTDEPLPKSEDGDAPDVAMTTPASEISRPDLERNFMERFISWYADRLLQPWVQAVVLVVFLVFFAVCTYSTTLMRQEFILSDFLPKDSMVTSFQKTMVENYPVQRFINVYFRNVDQSDPSIQKQMTQYVQELADLPQIGELPQFFWLRDFQQLASSEQVEELGVDIDALTFNEQLDLALSIPAIQQVYGRDVVRDEISGNITASRTILFLRHMDLNIIEEQVDMLMYQREISFAQPINSPEKLKDGELSFFTFDDLYFFWEMYAVTVNELIFTTVSCVVAVCVITCVFIPHWSAMLFVTPLIIVLYFMLMGTMQFCGLKVNSVTFFIIVMSIGLLVDFLMHVLLRYYETKGTSRKEKVKETLETMGASVLLGGFTTWLAVIPLAFSGTKIFNMVFISFLAMVTLGLSVGLAVLPVLLSLVGPTDSIGRATFLPNPAGVTGTEMTASNSPEATTEGAPSVDSKDDMPKEEIVI